MKEVTVITRNLVAGLGFKLPSIWLAAALLGFLLGALTAPYLPLLSNAVLQGRELAHELHIENQQQNVVIENPDVLRNGGASAEQDRTSEQIEVEVSLAGNSTSSGGEEKPADLIVEEVDEPPKQEYASQEHPSAGTPCNMFEGQWVPDPEGPLYSHDACSVLSGPQNCQANGRPDKGYEYWKWQPRNCTIPRFDPLLFLEIMKGKTLAFVGDSVARNHMESLMCILMQAEKPISRGSKKMQRWYFRSHSVTIIRIWSSWLVHTSFEAIDIAPEGLTKLHLDKVDENFDDFLPTFDVLIVSAGHWFVKKAAFVKDEKVVGGQLWKADAPGRNVTVDSRAAFAFAMRTALNRIISHPNYKGLTILRTYSPDHYSGGEWNSGGSCTGRETPLKDGEVHISDYTSVMRQHQIDAYNEAIAAGITNPSKLRLMDITTVFEYRPDGHPGPYRNQNPNKQTTVGPNGKPPPQDCLHWCMPGPIDTWNVFVLEMLKQDIL